MSALAQGHAAPTVSPLEGDGTRAGGDGAGAGGASQTTQFAGPLLDAGWLFLLAGLALLIATVLIPAQRDVAKARHNLAQAAAIEDNRLERMRRYQEYLDALKRGDEATVRALAAVQLNQAPEGTALLTQTGELGTRSASVFPSLEPPPVEARAWRENPSLLERWATDDRTRLWLIAGGGFLVLIGLLPPARPRGS